MLKETRDPEFKRFPRQFNLSLQRYPKYRMFLRQLNRRFDKMHHGTLRFRWLR